MFRLALALGKTVAELERELGPDELAKWVAYSQLEPFGYERVEYSIATVAATVANVHSRRRYKPDDFMPRYGRKAQQTVEQMKAKWDGFLAASKKHAKGSGR